MAKVVTGTDSGLIYRRPTQPHPSAHAAHRGVFHRPLRRQPLEDRCLLTVVSPACTADTYISEIYPNQNFGTDTALLIQNVTNADPKDFP